MVAEILEKQQQQQQHPQPKMTRNCPAWSAKVPLPCRRTKTVKYFYCSAKVFKTYACEGLRDPRMSFEDFASATSRLSEVPAALTYTAVSPGCWGRPGHGAGDGLGDFLQSSFFEVERDRRVTLAKWRGRWRCGTTSSYAIMNENWMILSRRPTGASPTPRGPSRHWRDVWPGIPSAWWPPAGSAVKPDVNPLRLSPKYFQRHPFFTWKPEHAPMRP
ncbi:hypothetical protein EYF80_062895 [Liparis tanakae]|uniref:Uncharacterized protein n=1 Tax=Liparis tanakae TaxID=230148 RepID=A0A4Z2EE13_9TELE|nr:hypothetical protein EYF80_062895 [Liparis tanakae]